MSTTVWHAPWIEASRIASCSPPLVDPIARRWAHQVPENYAAEMAITLTRFSYWGSSIVATHGSPWDQDAHVPILFYGPGVKAGRYTTFARTVDIGVTLAALAGVRPT